jgi:F-type H+-transporting ATPase subunit delta
MAELTTIARPYAEAVFELACGAGTLSSWSGILELAAAVAGDPKVQELAGDPLITHKQLADAFIGICGERLDGEARNFVQVLVENDRLTLLPEIREMFEELRQQHEGVLEVAIESAFPIDEAQRAELVRKLQTKYGRTVSASVTVTPELIGGVRVHVGDEVLDASVRARLDAMQASLLQ